MTGVPGLQAFVESDPARLMREMVLKNQVLLGTVNAGPTAFAVRAARSRCLPAALAGVVRTLIAGRYPPEQAPDLILGRPAGIKSVITFDAPGPGRANHPVRVTHAAFACAILATCRPSASRGSGRNSWRRRANGEGHGH